MSTLKPARLLVPLGVAVCLALFGDLTLYAVLATEREAVGLSLGAVGVMLAANRLIRIPGNPLVGRWFDVWGRRRLFILGMTLGTLSTALYGLTRGFAPFLLARFMWGTAWMLINIGGTAMILDISTPANRGKLIGSYNVWMLLGFALGPWIGGWLVDALGFRVAMLICAGFTAGGLLAAVLGLPETAPELTNKRPGSGIGRGRDVSRSRSVDAVAIHRRIDLADLVVLWRNGLRLFVVHPRLLSAALLYLLILFVGEGVALSTFNLWLEQNFGATLTLGTLTLGVAAASGFLAGARALVAGISGPVAGALSDAASGRNAVIGGGMLISAFGLVWLAFSGSPLSILLAVLVSAVGDGAVRATLTATLGDFAPPDNKGLVMGMYATIGDVGSTLGPLLAFALLPFIGLRWLYALCAFIFVVGLGLVWRLQRRWGWRKND